MATSGQKHIAKNRAPRVHIEYEVEVGNAIKKVHLPFVMGVMADLSGKPAEALPAIKDRKFLDIDAGTFDDRLKAMKPRVAVAIPNTLTGEGNLSVDITFEKLEDFSPDAVARKVGALNQLLQAREQLQNLLAHLDGRDKPQELITELLKNEALLQAFASTPKSDSAESKE